MSARGQSDDGVGMDFLQSLPRRWVVTYIPLGIFVFVLLFPFYWMAVTSFKPNEELLSRGGCHAGKRERRQRSAGGD